jgi:hypothetical protein
MELSQVSTRPVCALSAPIKRHLRSLLAKHCAGEFIPTSLNFERRDKRKERSRLQEEPPMRHSQEQMYLLTIRGTLAPASLEAARQVPNQTAGAPEGVAAAKSLGDLSHLGSVPVKQELAEIWSMDLWTSPSGLNQFFSDPNVQRWKS